MRIAILSRNENLYSTMRLKQAGEERLQLVGFLLLFGALPAFVLSRINVNCARPHTFSNNSFFCRSG